MSEQLNLDLPEPEPEPEPAYRVYKFAVEVFVNAVSASSAMEEMTTEFDYLFGADNQLLAVAYLDDGVLESDMKKALTVVTVDLVFDLENGKFDPYDAVNELLREHQQSFAPQSCLMDYGVRTDKIRTVVVEGDIYEEGMAFTRCSQGQSTVF